MSDIGIKGIVVKNATEISDLVKTFIKSSLNVREGITRGGEHEICMLSLIRDTYMCNLILRYVGMMTLLSPDPKWNAIDNRMTEYMQDYYNNIRFKNKLIELHEHYLKTFEDTQINYDYCRFLDKMINKADISKKGVEIRKITHMIENRVFNILNMNPVVKIAEKYFDDIPHHYDRKHGKVIVPLTKTNYHTLIDHIDDLHVRHQIETQYTSRTQNALVDFSKLIVSRKLLAEQAGYSTYFKYINKSKHDNSDTIKEFIIELNNKINNKIRSDMDRIYHFFSRSFPDKNMKICSSDVIKYVRVHRNNTKFEPKQVFYAIFNILDKYFNIKLQKIDERAWRENVIVYNMSDKKTKKLMGRLYLDIMFDENKKISDPISIRLSDKMQINTNSSTHAEVALLANYQNTKCMTYQDVVLLFKEFGYMLIGMCYDSRVGLVNYDDEFSNYLPSLMEYIAWDRETIQMVVGALDTSIIDHIEIGRELDMCYNIKMKCINAKFDHLIHNSEPLLDIIIKAVNQKNDASAEILETYKDIYTEIMSPIADTFMIQTDNIDPSTMIQEIAGTHSVLYSNLMNEIFAYATYWIIKENLNKKDSIIVEEFRSCILDNGVDNYRDLVRTFLKKIDVNCFSLYIKNVIKTESIDDYVTEDTNYFEEDRESDESDQDDIIQITRI
jgi:Zn-dependent oligopeptidase